MSGVTVNDTLSDGFQPDILRQGQTEPPCERRLNIQLRAPEPASSVSSKRFRLTPALFTESSYSFPFL